MSAADIAAGPAALHAGAKRQRRGLHDLHLPGAGRRRHGERRSGSRSDRAHDDGERHRSQRRAGTDERQVTMLKIGLRLLGLRLRFTDPGNAFVGSHRLAAGRRRNHEQRRRGDRRTIGSAADIAAGLLRFTPAFGRTAPATRPSPSRFRTRRHRERRRRFRPGGTQDDGERDAVNDAPRHGAPDTRGYDVHLRHRRLRFAD